MSIAKNQYNKNDAKTLRDVCKDSMKKSIFFIILTRQFHCKVYIFVSMHYFIFSGFIYFQIICALKENLNGLVPIDYNLHETSRSRE